jgi:hydrogenase maturation protease
MSSQVCSASSGGHAQARAALVIGYGNTLRRDDGAGPMVADAVAGWGVSGLTAWSVHQLTPELAESVSRADLVVFVDARHAQGGEKVILAPVSPDPSSTGVIGHVSDPGVVLYLAEALYGRCPEAAWLITIPAIDLEMGEGLSPQAQAGVQEALARVADLVGKDAASVDA